MKNNTLFRRLCILRKSPLSKSKIKVKEKMENNQNGMEHYQHFWYPKISGRHRNFGLEKKRLSLKHPLNIS